MDLITWDNNVKSNYLNLISKNTTAISRSTSWGMIRTTESKSSGKWYAEITINSPENASNEEVRFGLTNRTVNHDNYVGSNLNSIGLDFMNARIYYGGNSRVYGEKSEGSTVGIAIDLDDKTIKYFIDGVDCDFDTEFAREYLINNNEIFLAGSVKGVDSEIVINCGNKPFAFDVPEGYLPYDFNNAKWFNSTLLLSRGEILTVKDDGIIYPDIAEPLRLDDYEKWALGDMSAYNEETNRVRYEMKLDKESNKGRIFKKTIKRDDYKINKLRVR